MEFGLGLSLNAGEDLSFDGIDYLAEHIEKDLLNFTDCEDLNYSLLPDTPPETPVNYQNSPMSCHSVGPCISLTDNFDSSTFANSHHLSFANFAVSNSPLSNGSISNGSSRSSSSSCDNSSPTVISSTPTTIFIPQANLAQSPPTIATCISPSSYVIPSLVNCHPVLSNVDLNGFQLNGNSLVFSNSSESNNGSCLTKNPILPKSSLHSQISPKMATGQQKEMLKMQTLEARKLRNREAALNSRQKKKEYVEGLEENVKKLSKERDALLTENKFLKCKVKDLESQLFTSAKTRLDINGNYDSNKKAKISYFAVLFMVCIQVSPYVIPMSPSSSPTSTNSNLTDLTNLQLANSPLKAASPQKHVGRTLLWESDSEDIAASNYLGNRKGGQAIEQFNSSSTQYANASIMCKDYFNKTESMRLENELRDWLTRFQLEEKHLQQMQQLSRRKLRSSQQTAAAAVVKSKGSSNKRLLFDSKYVPIPRLKMWMTKQKYGADYLSEQFQSNSDDGETAEPQLDLDYENLMATVHRRDDTFYYLSYPSKGHLILPPISNRSDVRPRFSFLIPTYHNLSLDESSSPSSSGSANANQTNISPKMFILQIDCQVINTKVTLINDESRFGNKTENNASKPPTRKNTYKIAKNASNNNKK